MATTNTITSASVRGIRCSRRSESQSKVDIDTVIITATKAANGICTIKSFKMKISTIKNEPDTKLDKRPLPPEFTLTIACPIIAQPQVPLKKPDTILARPSPLHSRLRSPSVSVISSITFEVNKVSTSPTNAKDTEYGKIMRSVSIVSGTSGM